MRLIDADALLKELKKSCEYHAENSRELSLLQRDIIIVQEQPTVDAVRVDRDIPKAPTDKELEEDGYGAWGSLYGKCPNCGKSVYDEQNYCENCGQRLDWSREQGILQTTPNYSKRENGDPNGFNDQTVQALKDTTEGKNLSNVYETLDDMYEDNVDRMIEVWREDDDMYADMDVPEWREYIYRVRETADGIDSDCMAELIRCEKCKWYYRGGATCMYWYGANNMCSDDFCSRAERKQE